MKTHKKKSGGSFFKKINITRSQNKTENKIRKLEELLLELPEITVERVLEKWNYHRHDKLKKYLDDIPDPIVENELQQERIRREEALERERMSLKKYLDDIPDPKRTNYNKKEYGEEKL
jgi:hypothetical protein